MNTHLTTTSGPLAKLAFAAQALVEARSLDEIKQIRDIASAAETYAKAAKLGLQAQNQAAEIKLRAERKAGELLAKLERTPEGRQPKQLSNVGQLSEYKHALVESDTSKQQASRWQAIATLPEEVFESHIAKQIEKEAELTTHGMVKLAKEFEIIDCAPLEDWSESQLKRKSELEQGITVVANKRRGTDEALISWASQRDLVVLIDRNSIWGNPFELPDDGDREAVCDNYENYYIPHKPSLLKLIPSLKGKLLVCWCHPERCHGHYLQRLANAAE